MEAVEVRRGWFAIPGEQEGDRTVAEQMEGLRYAIRECRNKTVLDLGCAEGLISQAFARAGAVVHGVDVVPENIEVARRISQGITFDTAGLGDLLVGRQREYDIVLALSVLHKLVYPFPVFPALARWCRDLCVVRLPSRVFFNTHAIHNEKCDCVVEMKRVGFA